MTRPTHRRPTHRRPTHRRPTHRRLRTITLVAAGLIVAGCGASDPAAEPTTMAAASGTEDVGDASMTAHGHPEGIEAAAPMEVAIEVTSDAKAGANLHVTTSGFRWAPEHASGEHRDAEGHAHVYVDGEKLGRLYGPWTHLALDAGDHEVRVTLNANDHRDYLADGAAVEASARVTVATSAGAMAAAAMMTPEALAAEICALGASAREDPQAAADRFNGRIHGPLHDVANALMETDRARAGQIMEAKAVVEDLVGQESAAGEALGEALGDALVTLARALPGGEDCMR